MAAETAIEMFVGGLLLDPNTQAPVIVLKDETGEVHLPIWIGIAEATSIASAIKQIAMARPLTHDLMYDVLVELSVKVERIVITELKESTYYAELILSIGDRVLILDARPSDAIAIALRATAPIFVTQQVLEQAKITFSSAMTHGERVPSTPEEAAEEAQEGQDGQETKPAELGRPDFKDIDKEKWQEILDELEADDFKYKM